MKDTNFPLKKIFEKEFSFYDGEKLVGKFVYRYEQATIQEYHEFFAKSHEEQILELYQEFKKQIPLSNTEKILSFIFEGYKGKLERRIDVDKEIVEIMENKFRIYKSIYDDLPKKQSKGSSKKSLYSANLSIVCQKYCISPVELFKNFTLEQYMWLQDGIVFISNEVDDEGKLENQMALVDKEEVKKRAEETRKAFESNS